MDQDPKRFKIKTMSRRYHRYRKRSDNPLSSVIGLAAVGATTLAWQSWQENDQAIIYYVGATVVILLIILGGLAIWKHLREQRKLQALDIVASDTMDPLEFEVYVAKLLKHRGFSNVRLTERYDYGVDIVAEKDGVRWGVQVKRYSNIVKAEAVRQVVTALIRYKCTRAMVVTNSTFSRPAKELAADNNCMLVDRDILSEWIVQFQNSHT